MIVKFIILHKSEMSTERGGQDAENEQNAHIQEKFVELDNKLDMYSNRLYNVFVQYYDLYSHL